MSNDNEPARQVHGIRVAIEAQVDGGRNPKKMSLETLVPQDISIGEFNAVVDVMRSVLERQTAAYEIVNVEDTIDRVLADAAMAKEQVDKIDQRINERNNLGPVNGRRHVKVPENEMANRQAVLDRIDQNLAAVASHRKLLAKLRGVVDGGGTNSATVNNAGL